jgi:hypothetical protein
MGRPHRRTAAEDPLADPHATPHRYGLARLSRAITGEILTASLATLRLHHEAERPARREKVVFRADTDVLTLLEQAILDAANGVHRSTADALPLLAAAT